MNFFKGGRGLASKTVNSAIDILIKSLPYCGLMLNYFEYYFWRLASFCFFLLHFTSFCFRFKKIYIEEYPRCGYESDRKSNMRKHLFVKKNECHGVKQDIELTDDIKKYILDNKVYTLPLAPPPQVHQTFYQTLNYYNQCSGIINKMDPIDKIKKPIGIWR